MKFQKENAERLKELVNEINERVEEFKHLCRTAMSRSEYDLFKYRTLGNLEPAVMEESEWVTRGSSIDSLEKVANQACDENAVCKKCGSVIEDDYCTDDTCPYSDCAQDEEPDTEPKQD